MAQQSEAVIPDAPAGRVNQKQRTRAAIIAAARDLAYRALDLIDWPGGFCRRDIGWRAISRKSVP